MKYTIHTSTMLAAMFLLGSGVPGLAMESKSDDTSRPLQTHQTILDGHDVDENRIFEVNRESMHSQKPAPVSENRTADSQVMPSSTTGQKEKKTVEIDHDFSLHP